MLREEYQKELNKIKKKGKKGYWVKMCDIGFLLTVV